MLQKCCFSDVTLVKMRSRMDGRGANTCLSVRTSWRVSFAEIVALFGRTSQKLIVYLFKLWTLLTQIGDTYCKLLVGLVISPFINFFWLYFEKEWVLKIYRVSLIKLREFVDQKFNKLFYIMDTNALALKFQYNTERNDNKSLRFNRREEAWLYFGKKTCEWPGTLLGDPANPLRRHLQSPFSRLQLYNGWLQ